MEHETYRFCTVFASKFTSTVAIIVRFVAAVIDAGAAIGTYVGYARIQNVTVGTTEVCIATFAAVIGK